MFPPPEDWDTGYDNFDEWSFPEGFLPDDLTEDQIETIGKIQDITGLPVQTMLMDFDQLAQEGRAGQIRAKSFSTGLEAMLWLFRTGIFLYSNVVHFSDGTWGVAVGDSPRPGGDIDGQPEQPSF